MILEDSHGDLARLQRWMLSVITHPDGVVRGMSAPAAQQAIAASPDELEQLVERSRNQTSEERLHVYGNAYFARLIECLEEEFRAVARAVGEETFRGFAFEYVQAYPPRSYTLAKLGANFPRFLSETRPRRQDQDARAPDWADFLIDLATLERAYAEVFDAPGAERERTVGFADLAAIGIDQWPHARLRTVGSLRLLDLRFPAHEFAAAVRHDKPSQIPSPSRTHLVVRRRGYVVSARIVSEAEFAALQALGGGWTIGEVISQAAASLDLETDRLAAQIRAWFTQWGADALFREISLSR